MRPFAHQVYPLLLVSAAIDGDGGTAVGSGSPTLRRRRLGSELRRLRESTGLTHRQVAEHLDCSQGKISQIELGRVPVRTSDVRLMLQLFGADEATASTLLAQARESKEKGWWWQYTGALPPGFDTLLSLEADARSVSTFDIDLVPGPLQTADYARAVLAARGVGTSEAEALLAVLGHRQRRLAGQGALGIRAVVDEAALRRVVGGVDVMRAQLRHLVAASYRSSITLQVLPFAVGAHPLLGEGVVVFEFADPGDPRSAVVQGSSGYRALDRAEDVGRCAEALDMLRAIALAPKESAQRIAEIADSFSI